MKRHALLTAAAVILFSAGFVAAETKPTPPRVCVQMSQNDIINCLNRVVGAHRITITDLLEEVGTLKAAVADLQTKVGQGTAPRQLCSLD